VIGTILVGYDGSRPAERALERAAELARLAGARVIVVRVETIEPVVGAGAFGLAYPLPLSTGDREPDDPWREHRERVEALLHERGVEHEFATALGPPDDEIIAQAEQHRADLIVVGTREPGFLQRLLAGSVSAGVVRKAHCDVLVVHPDRE
jgi:nucleotide-binding universal stress UspA family protein